jgi:hypothetical protein
VIAAGRGRKPSIPAGTVEEVLRLTHKERPADGSTHWSTRSMAARVGIGKDTVAKIWADHELKPWKVDTFKISNDPAAAASNLPPPSSDSAAPRSPSKYQVNPLLQPGDRQIKHAPRLLFASIACRPAPQKAHQQQNVSSFKPGTDLARPSRRPEVVQLRLR